MTNLDDWPEDLLIARGKYATVRGEHEDQKKKLSVLCGQFGSIGPQVLRLMQPDTDDAPEMAAVVSLLVQGRETLNKMEACIDEIEALAMLRSQLKPLAWPK